MVPRFTGKVVLITGGGSGIGRAMAERFAGEGAKVAVADLNGEAAKETVEAIAGNGGAAVSVEVDVRDEASVRKMTDAVKEKAGPPSVLITCCRR
ncbi:MAG: SDR family NAD(P)-dependent oxidoreductase [Geminicoccaceae bacterium]